MPSRALPTDPTDLPSFAELGLPRPLVDALKSSGVVSPFPIQAATIPDALAGRDVLGRGETGSGKSYAFLLPLVARLMGGDHRSRGRRPRALVLAPTRELAAQLGEALAPLASVAGLRQVSVYGGVPARPQINAFERGVDIVIACPGRLNDHVKSGRVDLGGLEVTVLDEADHMADLGFLPDVRRILDRSPDGCQRLLFSATLDSGVDVLVKRYLSNPVVHELEETTSEGRTLHRVVRIDAETRLSTLTKLASTDGRVVVFTRTKSGARRLAKQLTTHGVPAVELHGDLTQGARKRNLAAFSSGSVQTLVATDIAARGIHVDDVALVVHADPPADHKAYVHRSGRTARAGTTGTVVTLAHDHQVADVQAMARKAKVSPEWEGGTPPETTSAPSSSSRRKRRSGGQGGQGPRRSGGAGGGSRQATSRQANNRQGGNRSGGRAGSHQSTTHSAAGFSAGR